MRGCTCVCAGLDGRFLNMSGMPIKVCGFLKCHGKILEKRQRKASGREHGKEKVSFTPFEPVHFKAKFHRYPKKDMKHAIFWPNILQLKRNGGGMSTGSTHGLSTPETKLQNDGVHLERDS